ncbi:hypothetical protein PRIPAC_85417 [Pristionchus pacificus]|nr:hypothetical protein PRIPAC_85417 [Pristionchus pacificus]|eukprot:PDM66702.1 Calcineurin-like phosphoesterase [Pristionchus pacificus]
MCAFKFIPHSSSLFYPLFSILLVQGGRPLFSSRMDKGTRALEPGAPLAKPVPIPATAQNSKPRISLSADSKNKDIKSKSTTDSQRSKSDTKSSEQSTIEQRDVPDTDSLTDEQFVTNLLMRLLKAKVIDDDKTDRRKSESLEDGPPSRADVAIGPKELIRLTALAVAVLLNDKCLLRIDKYVLPLLIVGDIHGQFIHLRSLFEMFGGPAETAVLFLGDYVDRGVQGIECMCLLLAMKIKYSKRIYMLRGNHEDANTTLSYGFHEECLSKYRSDGQNIWESFVNVFNVLPLAAIVNKKIFCVHGGLSPYMTYVEEIDKIARPLLIPAFGLATDLVWADPDQKNPGWSLSPRGVSFNFDAKAVEEFCVKNCIDLIVRGHQINTDMHNSGYKFFCGGRLITIFSAPNYLNYHNAAAVMKVSREMTIVMTVFRSSDDGGDDERVKREQFMKEREERRKARKKAPAAVTPTVSDKKGVPSDSDTREEKSHKAPK